MRVVIALSAFTYSEKEDLTKERRPTQVVPKPNEFELVVRYVATYDSKFC